MKKWSLTNTTKRAGSLVGVFALPFISLPPTQAQTATPSAASKLTVVPQVGHYDTVHTVALSPDGSALFTGGLDATTRRWNLATGATEWIYRQNGPVTALAISRDGKWLAQGDFTGGITVLRPSDGRVLARLKGVANQPVDLDPRTGAEKGVSELRFLESESTEAGPPRLAVLTRESTTWTFSARILEFIAPNSNEPGRWKTVAGPVGKLAKVRSCVLDPRGQFALCGDEAGNVHQLFLQPGKPTRKITVAKNSVLALALSPDGTKWASGGEDGVFQMRETETGKLIRSWPAPPLPKMVSDVVPSIEPISNLAFTASGSTLAVRRGSDVEFWNLSSGALEKSFRAMDNAARMSLTATGDSLFVYGNSLTGPGNDLTQYDLAGKLLRQFPRHEVPLNWVHYLGRQIITGGEDAGISRWSFEKGDLRCDSRSAFAPQGTAAFPDGRRLLVGDYDGIGVLDTATDKSLWKHFWGDDGVMVRSALAVSPNSQWVAAGYVAETGVVRLWNAKTGKPGRQFLLPSMSDVTGVAFSPDGRFLAASYGVTGDLPDQWMGRIRVWRLSDGKEWTTFTGHSDLVWQIQFSPSGQTLASASYDGTVRLWNLATKKLHALRRTGGHSSNVAFSPDGRFLAAGSGNQVVIWPTADAKDKGRRLNLESFVNGIAYSPDGRTLAVACENGTVCLFRTAAANNPLTLMRSRHLFAKERDYIGYLPNGRFSGSPGAGKLIKIRENDEVRDPSPDARLPSLLEEFLK